MYLETYCIKNLEPEDIGVRVDIQNMNPISVWDNKMSTIMMALSIIEAEALNEKLGFALQDYKAQLNDKVKGE